MSKRILVAIAWAMAWNAPAQPQPREQIFWYYQDFAPYYILSGPDRGRGIAEERLRILTQQLPQFQHQTHIRRFIDEEFKTNPDLCNASALKSPEREAIAVFSGAVAWTLPNGVITTRKRLQKFKPHLNERGELRFDEFLSNRSDYRVGTSSGRRYGEAIDPVLRKHPSRVVVSSSTNLFASLLLKLANQNELDAIIGYAIELKYVTRHLRLTEDDFAFLPIAEDVPLRPVYVACSRSELGRRVVAAIDRAITDERVLTEIEASYRAWLDKASRARYEQLRRQMRISK